MQPLASTWPKLLEIRSSTSELFSRDRNKSVFGRWRNNFESWNTSFARVAALDPWCGVPRNITPIVLDRIEFGSNTRLSIRDMLSASLTTIPPRLWAMNIMGTWFSSSVFRIESRSHSKVSAWWNIEDLELGVHIFSICTSYPHVMIRAWGNACGRRSCGQKTSVSWPWAGLSVASPVNDGLVLILEPRGVSPVDGGSAFDPVFDHVFLGCPNKPWTRTILWDEKSSQRS